MTARRIAGWARVACLIVAAALLLAGGPIEAQRLAPSDLATLAGMALLVAGLTLQRSRSAEGATTGRTGRLLPLLACAFAAYGWYEAAALEAFAALVRPLGRGRGSVWERLLWAGLRVVPWIALAPLQERFMAAVAPLAPSALGTFVAGAALWFALVRFAWIDVFGALERGRGILTLWRARLPDPLSLGLPLLELGWGYVTLQILVRDGAALALAAMLPLPALGALAAELAHMRARVRKLTLSHEAVEAMLLTNDPLPQIRSILEGVRPGLSRESIEIFVLGRPGTGTWVSVARLGRAPAPAFARDASRALHDLQTFGDPVQGVRGNDGLVLAYAAYDAEHVLVGALAVYRPHDGSSTVPARAFERAAGELGLVLADYGAIAATRYAASIDALTGLVNRRAVGRAVTDAMAYVRAGGSYVMLLLDIDHFKSVNDLLGHNAGDRALARIGAIIAGNIREGDVAGRYGGEEFLVLMRDADRDHALMVAERLRSAIEAGGMSYAGGAPITVSIGVAYVRATDASGESVIERADRALYHAKHTGRNRVVESPLVNAHG